MREKICDDGLVLLAVTVQKSLETLIGREEPCTLLCLSLSSASSRRRSRIFLGNREETILCVWTVFLINNRCLRSTRRSYTKKMKTVKVKTTPTAHVIMIGVFVRYSLWNETDGYTRIEYGHSDKRTLVPSAVPSAKVVRPANVALFSYLWNASSWRSCDGNQALE